MSTSYIYIVYIYMCPLCTYAHTYEATLALAMVVPDLPSALAHQCLVHYVKDQHSLAGRHAPPLLSASLHFQVVLICMDGNS